MLRRAAQSLARREQAIGGLLETAVGGLPAPTGSPAPWRALQQSRALHPSAAAQLEDEKPPSGTAQQQQLPPAAAGGSESVLMAAAAAAAQAQASRPPGAGLPGITKLLGFSGALPFWIFAPPVAQHLPLDLLVDPSLLSTPGLLQVAYGATILSFLGGVHWGLAMTNVGGELGAKMNDQRYLWSVLPCLMAWPTLAMPVPHAAGIQALLLGVVYSVDRAWSSKGLLPPWYMKLRLPLTVLAASGLVLTAASS